jgi:hypothetical protein
MYGSWQQCDTHGEYSGPDDTPFEEAMKKLSIAFNSTFGIEYDSR